MGKTATARSLPVLRRGNSCQVGHDVRKHDVGPERDRVNGKDCDADEEQERKLQNVHWQDGLVVV